MVFVTDGFPTECCYTEPNHQCPSDGSITSDQPSDLAAMAKEAFDTDKIRTFVVGFNLGLGKDNLDQIATAGGTGTAFLITTGDIGAQFIDAMKNISDTPLQCTFDIPKSDDPMNPTDPKKVAVTYTGRAPGSPTEEIPKLNTLGDCTLNQNNGWYYDNLQTPKQIIVCPGTCTKFGAGTVVTEVGCAPKTGIVQ